LSSICSLSFSFKQGVCRVKAEEVGAVICTFILLAILVIGVGNAAAATIELFLTDDWHYSVKAIHFLLLAYLSWRALIAVADSEENKGNS